MIMKGYCYNNEKAKKFRYSASGIKVALLFIIPILLCCILGFLANKVNAMFIYVCMFGSIGYIIWGVLNFVQCNKAGLISIVKYKDNALYLLINNNLTDLSWYRAVNKLLENSAIGTIAGGVVSIKLLKNATAMNEYLKTLMNNEVFLEEVLEKPDSKIANGIEIYKIMNINSSVLKDGYIRFNYDGFEKSNNLLFKNVDFKLLNVYDDFDELCNNIKEYKKVNEDTISINERERKKYSRLFNKNYTIFKIMIVIFLVTALFNIIDLFFLNMISLYIKSAFFFIRVVSFCLIIAYYEPTKNTNIDGINIKKHLIYTSCGVMVNLLAFFMRVNLSV